MKGKLFFTKKNKKTPNNMYIYYIYNIYIYMLKKGNTFINTLCNTNTVATLRG